ncbi:GNAT family N-acetyltransferase [Niveispirillum sp. SYP-B3756]|uniref:GNAT family N-acetyltransferase n=1 Tax=Niveispirillum sp. SYP-B3756 TaxID=2662178 RepID=UPI00129104CB|nr:N-acetyltransferase [Niveispirillum sp. SYP-B3756]MQP66715.1 GNAT family N-acetyltransferase [Niveispirillum sp. SYP-B3756]
MNITLELPSHAGAIEQLLDGSFGPKRHTKTVYRLRKGVAPVPDLCFVATDTDSDGNEKLIGTIRYWPIMLGGSTPALLLGPIAIDEAHRSEGVGGKMIRHSLAKAAEQGHKIVILVGDAPYYVRFGFARDGVLGLSLPGPVDPARFLGLELVEGALSGVTGTVGRAVPAKVRSAKPARPAAAVTMLLPTTPAMAGDSDIAANSMVSRRRTRRAAR